MGTVRLYGGPGNLPLAERRRSAAPAAELRPLCTAAGCSAVCRRTGFFQHKRPLLCRRGRRRLVHGGSAVSPETTRALFTGAGRILAAETGSKVQAVLYASGPLDCSVTVTPDEGVTWFGQSLTALDRPVEYAKLEFLTPELGFAAVGTQHSPGGGEEKYAFFTHNGGQSWTAFGALPHFGTSHILSGFSMTPDGTAFLTLATGPEENWPLLYCSADGGASWQTAELPWDDCALAYLNHLSRAEQRPEGFYVLLTQLPYSGGNAAFFAPTAQGPWSYAGDAIPDA